jgi:hypothetical protein
MFGLRCIAILAVALSACAVDRADHDQACESDRDCDADARCYEGFCLARAPQASCSQTNKFESCYEGQPSDSAGVGSCKAGQRFCVDGEYSECLGQVLPGEEVCNGRDDDCDGDVDNVSAMSSCDTHLRGACGQGTRMCRDGVEFCQPENESQTESCNDIDDDCDGPVDEIANGLCYPQDTVGCTVNAQGAWHCNGLCTTGQGSCDNTIEACTGAITPVEEDCAVDATFAQDEDCDGAIDESCTCRTGELRDCYAGPVGTLDEGLCAAGTQTCQNSAWGSCAGQTLPAAETCDSANTDQDCNGVEDDVLGLGMPCIAVEAKGECRNGTLKCTGDAEPECVAGEPMKEECDELDLDCDGYPNNGIDFSSSETCGTCDLRCSSSQTCCEGACVDPETFFQDDPNNCGACGNSCGDGRYCCQGDCLSATGPMTPACACTNDCGDKACCGDKCRDLETDKSNCGACGRKCGADQTCSRGTCRR